MNDLELKKEPKCLFDISFGSPLVALEALFNYVAIQKVFGSKRVLFYFIEKSKDRCHKLRENVWKYITGKKPVDSSANVNRMKYKVEVNLGERQDNHINIIKIKVYFYHCDLNALGSDFFNGIEPMVTFLDPFAFRDTLMFYTMSYIGTRRSIIVDFTIRDINCFVLKM